MVINNKLVFIVVEQLGINKPNIRNAVADILIL